MSAPDYPTGTVAIATVRGIAGVRVMRCGPPEGRRGNAFWWTPEYQGDILGNEPQWRMHDDLEVTEVRPLVVLDLDEAPLGSDNHYHSWLRGSATIDEKQGTTANHRPAFLRWLADQIEAQTTPRPAEPQGLAAVVANARGHKFVRVADPLDGWAAGRQWQRIGGDINAVRNFDWSQIDAVEVLTEGLS